MMRHLRGEAHALRLDIADLVRAAAGPDASRITVRRAQVGAAGTTTVTCDGRPLAVGGLDEPFERLRELSYRTGQGTWFTCELELPAGSRGYVCRTDGEAMPFAQVDPLGALGEMTLFPRDEPPGWLVAALPTAAPLSLPVSALSRPPAPPAGAVPEWRDHLGECHQPPITGEVRYTPATGMTARAARLDEGAGPVPGQRFFYLESRPGDPTAETLLVTAYDDVYCLARHPYGVTDHGVRSLALDGATLRLELAAGAADQLQTETVFEVALDLDAGQAATLRAAVPRVLGQAAGGPELIGF
ncbi:hypothetical protein [Nonomuraea sp. NPDC049309]|uniref:hypothetical protein n=1 Tax=Nonomuraea sp. NPDC049309 TaxID=3364350 RepID=UPI003717C570